MIATISESCNLYRQNPRTAYTSAWYSWCGLYNLGFNMVPCTTRTKVPIITYMDLFHRRQTEDEWAALRYRFRREWSCCFLYVSGVTPTSSVVVVDADDEAAEDFIDEHLPFTPLMVRSARGWHRIYRHPGHGLYIKPRATHVIDGVAYKIDVKADHQCAIAPGSLHQSNHVYTWYKEWTPELIASTPEYDPEWLRVDAKTEHDTAGRVFDGIEHATLCQSGNFPDLEERVKRAGRFARLFPGTNADGTSGKKAMALAGKLVWGYALPPEVAVETLMEFWAEREDQQSDSGWFPWSRAQIEHKVESALKSPGSYPGTPGDLTFPDEAEKVETILGRATLIEVPDIESYSMDDADMTADEAADEVDDRPPPDHDDAVNLAEADPSFAPPAAPKPSKDRKRRAYKIGDLANRPPLAWLIDQHFPVNSLGSIIGPSGVGKSFLALALGLSVASGVDYLGSYTVKQGPVAYISAEGFGALGKRVQSWLVENSIDEPPTNICFLPDAFDLQGGTEDADELIQLARDSLGEDPTLIIVDTLNRNFGTGDENDTKSMKSFVTGCDHLRTETGAAVLVIHHTGKDASRKERGSIVLRCSCDTMVLLDDTDGNKGVLVACDKQKDFEPFEPYKLAKKIVTTADGETSLVLVGNDQGKTRYQLLAKESKELLETLFLAFGNEPFGFTEAFKASKIGSKTTFGRRLDQLKAKSFVQFEDDHYRLAMAVMALIN